MWHWLIIVIWALLLPHFSYGQFPGQKGFRDDIASLLSSLQAEILFPLDGGYSELSQHSETAFFPCHYRISSRSEGMEIRFFLQPDTAGKIPPQIESRRLALHLCSNDEQAVITARSLSEVELDILFGADWGKVHLFPPKPEFGNGAPYCQMLSIYKTGRGMIHLFFFFAEPSPLVENRLYLARFQ